MKKYLLIILTLVLAFCGGCSQSTNAEPTVVPTPTPTPTPIVAETTMPRVTFEPWSNYEDVLPITCISWAYYETLSDLCKSAQHIVVGTVRDIEIVQKPEDVQAYDIENFRETVFQYTFQIEQTLSGNLVECETAFAWQMGWQYGDINVYHPDSPPLEYDKTYIMFLRENVYIENPIYPAYHFCIPFEAYPEIAEGVLHPHPRSNFFYDGMNADDAISAIAQEVALQDAPGQITAERGVDNLIATAAFAPDQTPVRDLSDEQMQTIYDFAGNALVLETVGKELSNGDLLIWIKTEKLTDSQQDDLYDALEAAAKRVAGELDGHYKVSCTPFHSMVSICDYNEDNATVHDSFRKVLDVQIDIDSD